MSKIGTWWYLDDEHTGFGVGWNDSVARWYEIVDETSEKLTLREKTDGPVGFGLFGDTELLKSSKTVVYTVPQ